MRQRNSLLLCVLAGVMSLGVTGGRANVARFAEPSTAPAAKKITVASLVPSATDLILAAGLKDQLVAVSNYCRSNPGAAALPAVGDYETTDWEKLATLKPSVMLVFKAKDRLPKGMVDRAESLGIHLEIVKVDTLAEVKASLERLGAIMGQPEATAGEWTRIEGQIEAAKTAVAGKGKPRTLVVFGGDGIMVAGPGGFLDEVLQIAGGENAAKASGMMYPSLDEESLRGLRAERVIVLLPGGTEQQVAAARQKWERRLAKGATLTVLTDWYLMLPGSHVGDVAQKFVGAIHPELPPSTQPSMETSGKRVAP